MFSVWVFWTSGLSTCPTLICFLKRCQEKIFMDIEYQK